MTKLIDNNISDEELINAFQIDTIKLQLIKFIIEDNEINLSQFKSVDHMRRQCFNPPNRINEQLEAINELTDGYGIEAVRVDPELFNERYWGDCIGLYVNFGDTYQLTIIYNVIEKQFEFTSWGDFIETNESKLRLNSTDY